MLSETIVDILKNEYKSGKKQAEIAKKYNLDQQTVSRLLSGKRNAAGLTLETVQKMFPMATIHIENNSGTSVGVVNGEVHLNGGKESGIPADILRAIIADRSLSPAEKAQLIKEIMK